MPARKSSSKTKSAAKPSGSKPPGSMPYEQGKWAAVFAPRAAGERRYWLIKSEPESFAFDDLLAAPGQVTCWDGVRNSGARNFLRDGMKHGDRAFFYHSNATPSAIVGICEVVKEGYPDESAFDPDHPYYDAGSDRTTPLWYAVDVRAIARLDRPVTLPEIKESTALAEMALLRVSRLAIVPVTPEEWQSIVDMGKGLGAP